MSIDPGNIIVRMNYAIFEYRRGNTAEAAVLIEPINLNSLGDNPDSAEIISRVNKLRSCLSSLQQPH